MSTVSNDPLSALRWQSQTAADGAKNKKELTQEDFFSLLSTQLAYQDPFKPADNSQMIAQMASFSTTEGIAKMNKQFETMNSIMSSNQALQASSLVGNKVLVPLETASLAQGGNVSGKVVVPDGAANLHVRVHRPDGSVVANFPLGQLPSGNQPFTWDGTDGNGNALPAGNYVIKASATIAGEAQELPITTYGHVDSVSLGGAGGVVLNLQGLGGVKLSDVLEVAQS